MSTGTSDSPQSAGHGTFSKVPAVTLGFWLIKIFATTVGETGGDALSMTLKLGYAVSTVIFLILFILALTVQVRVDRYHPAVYWLVVVTTTTVGTTTSDFFDRTLGIGYVRSSIILSICVVVVLALWRFTTGRLEFENIRTRKDEVFYWLTILIANTLGTALGDYVADDVGLGFQRGALVFAVSLAVVAAAHQFQLAPRSVLFWAAYVLTRPLGATVGDTITKPPAEGGFGLGRITSSLLIAAGMIVLIIATERRAKMRLRGL
jgi:uncharacterized membrane-anchored protein